MIFEIVLYNQKIRLYKGIPLEYKNSILINKSNIINIKFKRFK
jgi:hypothetical protein